MTPLQHNKYLGIAHLAYAGLQLIVIVVMLVFMLSMISEIFGQARRSGDDTPLAFAGFVVVFVGAIQVLFSIPPIVAGYAFLKRRPWTKIAGIIAGAVSAMNFPIGTALAVYTFWFLLSDVGKEVYENFTPKVPPPPPREWQNRSVDDGWVSYTPPTKHS